MAGHRTSTRHQQLGRDIQIAGLPPSSWPLHRAMHRRKRKHADTAAESSAAADAEASEAEVQRKAECEQRIAALQAEISQLEKGEHPDFKNKCIAFEQEKHSAVKQAERRKQDQIDNISSLFDFELKAGEDVFNHKVKEQQERMLEEWKQKLKRAQDESEGKPVVDGERMATRQLRSKTTKEDDAKPKKRGPAGATGVLGYSRQLPDDDIMKDLRAIHNDWKQHASKFSAASSYEVKVFVKNGQLYYKDLVLEKGHHVVVFSEASQEDMYGVITSVNATEVLVKMEGGQKNRIYVKNLRNGRCTINLRDDEG